VTTAIIVIGVILLLLAAGWVIASKVKRNIDNDEAKVSGVTRHVKVTSQCVQGITQLTLEPVLIRHDEINVSVQIGEQPLKPIETVPDKSVRAAYREAAVAMDAIFGPRWTAIAQAASETTLLVTRLA
jgi:hypothetical protein